MFFFDLTPVSSTLSYKKVDVDNYVILSTDYLLSVNNAGNNWSIILPDPSGIVGKTYIIKRYDNTSTGAVIISSAAGLVQTLNGNFQASATLSGWGFYSDTSMYMSNGTNWEFIK